MIHTKTIRIVEPHGGWENHKLYYSELSKQNNVYNLPDTGLCNRLYHWELFYHLYEQGGDDTFTLAAPDWIWPERELLDLPNTVYAKYDISDSAWYSHIEHGDLYFKTVFDLKNQKVSLAKPLTYKKIKSMYKSNNFDFINTPHWVTQPGYNTLTSLHDDVFSGVDGYRDIFLKNRPLRKIRLKDLQLQSKINTNCSNRIGIHIRRGSGVNRTEKDILSLPKNLQKTYREYISKNPLTDSIYNFIQDDIYFKFIDSILEVDPNKKFYISHDLSDEFLNHYYERYGDSIQSKKDIRNFYKKSYSKKIDNLEHLISYGNIVDNLIDLFSLASCPYIVTSMGSSWSDFASDYSPKGCISADKLNETLLNDKSQFVTNVLSHLPHIL